MTGKSQISEIQQHLESGRSITSMEAIKLYGATRLSGIIFLLRKRGMKIITIDHKGKNRYGNHCHFAEYKLLKED